MLETLSIKENYIQEITKDYAPCYAYKGQLNFDAVTQILEEVKGDVISNRVERNKLYAIAVELLENSFHHQASMEDEVELLILKNSNSYRVITINTLEDEDKVNLLSKTEELNNATVMKVKKLYKERMTQNFLNAKGSAGLGMELIRLKSQNEILISTDELPSGNVVVVDVKIEL